MRTIRITHFSMGCGCVISVPTDPGIDPDTPPIRWCTLHSAAPALLAAVKEMREAVAACFRIFVQIQELPDLQTGLSVRAIQKTVEDEFEKTKIAHGFGVRALMAVAQAENNLPEFERLKKIEAKRIAKEKNVQ
jgi:hypothetical protein